MQYFAVPLSLSWGRGGGDGDGGQLGEGRDRSRERENNTKSRDRFGVERSLTKRTNTAKLKALITVVNVAEFLLNTRGED